MKTKLLVALCAILGTGAHAVTITIDTAAFVQNASGVRIPDNTGVVAIGSYGAVDPTINATFTKTEIITGFTQLGQHTVDFTPDADGFFAFELTVNITNAFNGLPVYLIVANASDLASSTEFLVWKADTTTFAEDNPVGGPGDVRLDNTKGDLLAGTFSAGEFHLELAQVPEPSSIALLGFGGVALLLRRRR